MLVVVEWLDPLDLKKNIPAIRKASKSSIPTITGISCKQQIEDGTGVNAKYLTEVLADALQNKNEK